VPRSGTNGAGRAQHKPSQPINFSAGPPASREAAFEEISATVPSFAGYFLEGDNLVVLLTDPKQAAAAEASVRQAIAKRVPSGADARLDHPTILVRRAAYSFAQLRGWRDQIEQQALFGLSDAAWIDLNEANNQVVIGLADGSGKAEIEQALARLAVDPMAVTTRVTGRDTPNETLLDRVRPVEGGLVNGVAFTGGGSAYPWCTYSFNARYNGVDVILTASHCTSSTYANDATTTVFYQDTVIGNNRIGTEWYDPGSPFLCLTPTYPWLPVPCRYSDAAMIRYDAGVNYQFGLIARTTWRSTTWGDSGSTTIDGGNPQFHIGAEQEYPVAGQRVEKVGRTTGWTSGTVLEDNGTCVDTFGSDGVWRLCTYRADYYSDGGDSGSPVFIWPGGVANVTLTGIHWGRNPDAGYSDFSPLGGVHEDFGSMFVQVVTPLVAWIEGPTEVRPRDRFCVWEAAVSGGIPPYSYAWSGVLSGSNQYIGGAISGSGWLYLTVTDSNGSQNDDGLYITLNQSAPSCM
jgi:hypothetical protein